MRASCGLGREVQVVRRAQQSVRTIRNPAANPREGSGGRIKELPGNRFEVAATAMGNAVQLDCRPR